MGLRGEAERGSQREEKKWYRRIIAEEMDEGKGLSVQTLLFLTEVKLSNPQEKKLQLRGSTVRSTDSTQAISGLGWEWCDELHPGISITFEEIKKEGDAFHFLFCWRTLVVLRLQSWGHTNGERDIYKTDKRQNSDPTCAFQKSIVNCQPHCFNTRGTRSLTWQSDCADLTVNRHALILSTSCRKRFQLVLHLQSFP